MDCFSSSATCRTDFFSRWCIQFQMPWIKNFAAFAIFAACSSIAQQDSVPDGVIRQVSQNEAAAAHDRPHYCFLSEERSERTSQHLWLESVCETSHGPLRRLMAEDGRPLDATRQREVDARVAALASRPAELDAINRSRNEDQAKAEQMLAMDPHMFLYSEVARATTIATVAFRPDPAFSPSSYEQRAIHNMSGTMDVDLKLMRMVRLDAHLVAPVKFGYGLLGSIQSAQIHLVRMQTQHGDLKSAELDFKVNGRILLFHSVGRSQTLARRDFVFFPPDDTLAQAKQIVLSAKPDNLIALARSGGSQSLAAAPTLAPPR